MVKIRLRNLCLFWDTGVKVWMKRLFFLGVIIVVFVVGNVQYKALTEPYNTVFAQTIPTRTPVPPPTNPPGNGNPQPTATAVLPSATPTETPVPVTLAATPDGGFLPTAEPCNNMPTIQTRNNTNVRRGPGTDYKIVGRLLFSEIRPITGRAQNAPWWFIVLADGTTGFVLDDVVTVSGYTDIVPVVPAPELNGSTPTPGPEWNPTPNPNCTVTPTPLPTDTPVPTVTATPEPTNTDTAVPEATVTDTAVPPTETPTLVAQPTRVNTPTPLPAAVPLQEPATGNSNWLLFGAGGLLIVGVAIFVIRRR